jgi:hypothetical protein
VLRFNTGSIVFDMGFQKVLGKANQDINLALIWGVFRGVADEVSDCGVEFTAIPDEFDVLIATEAELVILLGKNLSGVVDNFRQQLNQGE